MAQPAPQKPAVAAPRTKKAEDPALGKVIAGRYRLEARIGEGGMGIVYRARHVLIDRVVAVKLIRPDLRGETHLRAWMLREARAANRVDHAHIIDIHDIGETDDGELYLVMEYLVGTPLSTELAHGPMPLNRGVDILEQMGAALSRAHDLGVVHRDLKSDNILLTHRGGRKDFVKILDFGLAALAHDPRLAPKGAVFGTPEYMSPEQARGEQAGPHSDLYALGVLFFEMLTGQLPFRAGDRDSLLEMQRTAPAPRPTSIRKDCHPAAERIVLRLLEKDPRKRYRDGHHLLEDVDAAVQRHRSVRELVRERGTNQVLHHEVQLTVVGLADIVDVDDVGVVDAIGRARFAQHPSAQVRLAAQVGANQLHRDHAIDEHVASAVHDAHAAFANAGF